MTAHAGTDAAGRQLRVLHLINGEYFGGSARVLVNYLSAETAHAAAAVAVFFPGELMTRLTDMGTETQLVAMRGRTDVWATRKVLRYARRWQADLIHTHQVRNTMLGRLASMAGGPPVVTHVHSPAFRESTRALRNALTGALDRALASRTRRFIAVSASLGDELRKLGIGEDRIRIVPNGIPLPAPADPDTRRAVREEFRVPADEPLVGMIANFRPRKGAELLIEAAASLAASGLPIRLLLVGEAFREGGRDYLAELTALARDRGIGERVHLTGFRDDVDRLLGSLDLFVLPSRFGEGMPMVLLEAMGSGVPVVTTPVEGITEVIDDGQNGLLVPVDDVAALAAAMRRALQDLPLRARLASAGWATVAANYTADRMVEGIEAVYRELVTPAH